VLQKEADRVEVASNSPRALARTRHYAQRARRQTLTAFKGSGRSSTPDIRVEKAVPNIPEIEAVLAARQVMEAMTLPYGKCHVSWGFCAKQGGSVPKPIPERKREEVWLNVISQLNSEGFNAVRIINNL
jgi:hypothetical protein